MSGAQLQTAGQVRNAYPFIMRRSISADLELVSTVPVLNSYTRIALTENLDVPFDYGPDKAGRVYIVINGVGIIVSADVYAAAGVIAGEILYEDTFGTQYLLYSLGDTLPNAKAYNHQLTLGLYAPLFSNNPGVIGYLVWSNVASAIGALDNVIAQVTLNIGYYSDYAEYDFNELKKCEHHHYHGIERDAVVDTTKV